MPRSLFPLLLLVASGAACGPLPRSSPVVPGKDSDRVVDLPALAASQVRRCYRAPPVSSEGRQIVTRLRVRFTADGQLAQMPVVVAQDGVNPRNRDYADRMAEAAIEAVMRCAPLRLPGLAAGRSTAFDLTFSPAGAA